MKMKINKPTKIVAITLLSLLVLALTLHIGVNIWIKKQLPQIIKEKNDTAYDFTFSDLKFSIFNNSISLYDAQISPKSTSDLEEDIDFMGKITKVSATGVNFIELLKNKNLQAFSIVIEKPNITVVKSIKKDSIESSSKLASSIDIDEILVKNADISMLNPTGDTLLYKVYNLNMSLDGIHMGEKTATKKIPFTYTDYKFKIDSIYSLVNNDNFIKSDYVDISSQHILIDNVRLYPIINSTDFKHQKTHSNTRMNVSIPKVKLTHTDWGYDKEDLYVNIGGILIDSVQFHITEQKKQTVLQQAKKDAEKIIQSIIPFRLNVDSLSIKKSSFNSLGIVQVNNVNIVARKISNRVYEQLEVDEFILNKPQLIHSSNKNYNQNKTSEPTRLNDRIKFKNIKIIDADYTFQNQKGRNILFVKNFNLSLEDVEINDQTVIEAVPFVYKNPKIKTGSLVYDSEKMYKLTSHGLSINEGIIRLNNLEMIPKITRAQHTAHLKWGEDYYNIKTGPIEIRSYDWGFDAQKEGYFKAKQLTVNSPVATIYRDVSFPNRPINNGLFSKKLRDIKFNFFVENLQLNNANLTYQETGDIKRKPGQLSFTKMNMSVKNIYSGYKRNSGPRTQINVSTVFMKNSYLKTQWAFDILDRSDRFTIKGQIDDFDVVAMSPFLKPYLKVEMTGKIDKMMFDFTGNNYIANGTYAMDFSGLKVDILREDGSKRKLLSAVGNMVVRTNSKGIKEVDIKPVERVKEKSFFNFLWLCVLQGLKQTII